MSYGLKILENIKIPVAIDSMCEVIDYVADIFGDKHIKVRWHKDKYFTEYGFYIDSADKKFNLFFGMWFDAWEHTGSPLCLALDWNTHTDDGKEDKFLKTIAGLKDVFLKGMNYNDYPIALFQTSHFMDKDCINNTFHLMKVMVEELGFGLYFSK